MGPGAYAQSPGTRADHLVEEGGEAGAGGRPLPASVARMGQSYTAGGGR